MPRKTEKKAAQGEGEQQDVPAENEGGTSERETVVLHPGSSYLYLGYATDSSPHAVPHLIAYRPTQSSDQPSENRTENPSLVLEYKTEINEEFREQREEGLEAVRRALRDYRLSLDMSVDEVDTREYSEYNRRQEPKERDSSELSLTDISNNPNFVIGNEVLYLPRDCGYQVYKPFQNGRLHIPPSQSLSSVLNQLEDLWTHAIEEYLDLPRKEFKNFQVVLLVPDAIDRQLLKEMMNVLFRMEFAAAILHQESVSATYSAGLSSGCVVDIGDEVTHICCVEDGMSNPNTRVTLNYGGSDITRLFYWLINQTGFPYRACERSDCLDGVLLQQLKESICHMDATQHGIHDYQFSVMSKTPGKLLDYEMKLSDEALLAPMGVFFPSSFCLPENQHLMAGQPPLLADSQDLYDEGHWTDQGQGSQGTKPSGGVAVGGGSEVVPQATMRLKKVPPGKILSIDQAIHFSIDCASSLDMKKKLYGSVLLVGGGLAVPGAAAALQSRLEMRAPAGCSGTVEVFTNPRDLESSMVCWRGGVILQCLDTAQEMWIEKQEWEFYGVRLLRERAPFQW